MKFGKAIYCDQCGCEIFCGDLCNECDPTTGSEQITYTFIVESPEQSPEQEQEPEQGKPWWKRW